MKCVSCDKKVSYLYKPRDGMIDSGIAEIIYAGYGSEFDGERFKIVVCDECIKKKLSKRSR
jgi:hypothetical protein